MSNIILKGGYLFLVWNSLKYKKYFMKSDFCYFMYKWIPGTITNFRKKKDAFNVLNLKNTSKKKVEDQCLRFPNFVINFGFSKNILIQEGVNLPIPFLSVVDTLHNINNFNFFVIYNTRSTNSSFFLYNIFLNFLKKMVLIKKSFFLNIFKKRLNLLNGTKR